MDVNNYTYTAPGFGRDVEKIRAYFEDFANFGGYVKMSIEQWGANKNMLYYVVSGFQVAKNFDFAIMFDSSDVYEERKAFEKAARYYNECVPVSECIPLF